MNYLKIYIKICRNAERRDIPEQYTESHHTFPRAIFGENDRIVRLTAKEHFICHFLLWKECKKRYGTNHYRTYKMHHAFQSMTWDPSNGKRYVTRSFVYAREASSIYNTGENNPAKRPEVREKISNSKKGKERPDMKGKAYFGADEDKIKAGIESMRIKKTGMKVNYPKNRNSPPCSEHRRLATSASRKKTKFKYVEMSDQEFDLWLTKFSLFDRSGRRNVNVTRALITRGIDVDEFYRSRTSE